METNATEIALASMGPRRLRRGEIDCVRGGNYTVQLQWGRADYGAESQRDEALRNADVMLQWGRAE